ncbi:alpha/beta fold hydrolase [Spirillospora sp. CA-255316]
MSALRPGDVLVGHSGGGYEVTVAADASADLVRHVVYLAALLPREGRTIPGAMTTRDAQDGENDGDVTGMPRYLRFHDDRRTELADYEGARDFFHQDCDEPTARWAFERPTPESFGDYHTATVSIPGFWEADLPRRYIVCLRTGRTPRRFSDVVVRRLGVERLTVEASYSPFLSRPREPAELLVHATTTVPVGPLLPD